MISKLTAQQLEECENLSSWAIEDKLGKEEARKEIDAILEWLKDNHFLNAGGIAFAGRYWVYTWHTKHSPNQPYANKEGKV